MKKEMEVAKVKNEKQKKKKVRKGFWSAIRESMTKTGGCCGPGETCGGAGSKDDREKAKSEKAKEADNSGQANEGD